MCEALGVLELVKKRDTVFEFQAFKTGAGTSGSGGDQRRHDQYNYGVRVRGQSKFQFTLTPDSDPTLSICSDP